MGLRVFDAEEDLLGVGEVGEGGGCRESEDFGEDERVGREGSCNGYCMELFEGVEGFAGLE